MKLHIQAPRPAQLVIKPWQLQTSVTAACAIVMLRQDQWMVPVMVSSTAFILVVDAIRASAIGALFP